MGDVKTTRVKCNHQMEAAKQNDEEEDWLCAGIPGSRIRYNFLNAKAVFKRIIREENNYLYDSDTVII